MKDIIKILPENVSNQIAAGEVVQRPASLIKELVENSIDALSNRIQVFLNESGKKTIKVVDNGIGMSKSVQSKIFDKFYRKQTGDLHDVKGHGLGLSYVKKIIAFHNGNISVESAIGQGSTFTIQLNTYKK